ncbi:winged helix-turn-helix domain-containing protein, partial [Micromonospora yasonensis]|uniref:AfsR/SARP family transcriptional regulator n=1 Tax=Micromonospora yasonensis TaxID=1128667 RepID=UPI0022310F59
MGQPRAAGAEVDGGAMSRDGAPSPVSFGLLGAVEVRVASRAAPLPPAVRALLARLLLAEGRVVAADALTDALWGEDPPRDAANALQLRVSKLRRALAAAGASADLLVTRAPGYRLAVPAEAVDAYRFERLLDRARTATASGSLDTALADLDAALALWRGPALADVGDAGWARAEGGRLEELRLGAVEDRLELLLALGRQAEAAADLEGLVAEHPLRERLHRLLMLARYRSGRQADALTAYHALRHRLADDLGIDPAPELRALAEAILRQQVPAGPAGREAAATRPLPDQVTGGPAHERDTATTPAPRGAAATPAPHGAATPPGPQGAAATPGPHESAAPPVPHGAFAPPRAHEAAATPRPRAGADRPDEVRAKPAAGSPTADRDALPRRLASVVGRHADLRRVREELRDSQVVTLTGPGGVGKTTLVLEAAREVDLPVHLVRLAGVAAGADLAAAVAGQLGLATSGADPVPALVDRLAAGPALLVVDNCEHLVDDAAVLVERLVEACPALRVLATSREALAVPGETQLAVAPLDVPEEGAPADRIAQAAAVRLFLDRARAVRPGFTLDAATAPVVADICRQLDGMPLAVELAAARVKALPPAEIAARLHDRFTLLTAGTRTSEARHRTLRATLDWSHDLLSEDERRLLRRLAVFRGGWDLAAAEEVCAFDGLAADQVLDVLFRLVDRSLVVPDPATGRFRLLVTVREYAWARLVAAGEEDVTVDRHLAQVTALAERYGPAARQGGQAWARLTEEHDNVLAAVDRCLARPDRVAAGFRLADALFPYWNYGLRDEGVRVLTALLATGRLDRPARALATQRIGLLGVYYPTPRTRAAARESLALFTELGDARNTAISRLVVAWEGTYDGDLAECRELVALARVELDDPADPWWPGMTAYLEALLDLRAGDFDRATGHWTRSLELIRRSDDRMLIGGILAHLGLSHREAGRPTEALRALTEAVGWARRDDSPHALAFSLVQLAHTRLDAGDGDGVAALFAEAVGVARRHGNPRCRAWAAWGRARLAYAAGDPGTAYDECRTALDLFADREFPWARRRLWTLTADAAAATDRADEADRARRAAADLAAATPASEPL